MFGNFLDSSLFSGLLNLNGKSISRLQRFIDLFVISSVFYLLQPGLVWSTGFINVPSIFVVLFITSIMLPNAGIYKSYRLKSLNRMFLKINSTWISIICFVILAAFLNKTSASYSRVAIALWGLCGWIWLIFSHLLSRLFLRRLRRTGRNSRTILYWGELQSALEFSTFIPNYLGTA